MIVHRLCSAVALAVSSLAVLSVAAAAQNAAPDVLVFTNGDQLTGKLVRAAGGSVVFHSDMAGDITVSFDKVKGLKSANGFVEIAKGGLKSWKTVPQSGSVTLEAGNVVLTPKSGEPRAIPAKDVGYLIDEDTFNKEMHQQNSFFHAWTGKIVGGATLVRSTQTATTLTAGINLVRAIPTVPFLPARNKTILNVTETYGKTSTPVIPPTTPASPAVVVKTSIFHADAERDEYFSPSFYALADTSFDHNYSQGLALQQVYGGGIGWSAIKSAKQALDLKGEVHYEMQSFLAPDATTAAQPSINIFGSTFSESYMRNLPMKLVFTEQGSYLSAWTTTNAYSAHVTAGLAIPVFKRLSASVSATDDYLNNPAQYYKANSLQFVTGVTYTLQ